MDINVGTCGRCGGRVTVPKVFLSVDPPIPTCKSCGAKPKNHAGPVIEMEGDPPKVGSPFAD